MAWREITVGYESRRKQITTSGISATRVFITTWSSYTADLINHGIEIGGLYPDGDCRVSSIAIEGVGKGHTNGTYDEAKITVGYSSGSAAERQEVGYSEESIEFGGEMLTKDGGYFVDCKADAPKEVVGGTFYPRSVFITEVTVDDIHKYAKLLRASVAKINASSWNGAEAETMLFDGANSRKFVNQKGEKRYVITFKFIYREESWNKLWHGNCEKGAHFETVKFSPFRAGNAKQQSNTFYETYSFHKLTKAFSELKRSIRVK